MFPFTRSASYYAGIAFPFTRNLPDFRRQDRSQLRVNGSSGVPQYPALVGKPAINPSIRAMESQFPFTRNRLPTRSKVFPFARNRSVKCRGNGRFAVG